MTPVRVAHVTTVDLTLRFLLLAQLRRLHDEGYEVTAISAPGPWAGELAAEGIRHIAWRSATRSWDPAADARAFGELLAILRRERFDLVHTHNPKPGILGRIASRLAAVPCVVNTVHGLYAMPEDRLRKKAPVLALEALASRCSDLELYQSAEDLDWARRLRVVSRSKSVLLGNGVDLARFDPDGPAAERAADVRRRLGVPLDAVLVGTVGRMVEEKGYREYFGAARRLSAGIPGVRFVAVGDADPEKADSIAPAESGGVVVTGWRTDVEDVIAAMDVFVLASWREGLPRAAMEAAAMGKALVLTDIRGCREVARDGIEGLLVPPRDAGRLEEAIRRVVTDPALRARLGAAARARALDRFDESRVTSILARSYRELLARKGISMKDAPAAGAPKAARP